MATKTPFMQQSFTAGADLSTHQWKAVMRTGANTVGLQGASGVCAGILQNEPRLGEAATVMQVGLSPAYADGSGTAIAVGDRLYPNASGVFLKAAVGTEANQVAVAEEACTIAGGIITVNLKQA